MKKNAMKKAAAVLLILLMTFAAFGCGSKGDEEPPQDTDSNTAVTDTEDEGEEASDGEETIEEGTYDEAVKDDASDIDAGSYSAEDMQASFDFGFSVSRNFGMSAVLEKMSYKNLENLTGDLEERMNTGIKSSLGGSYDVFSSYEPEEEDDMDDLVLAAAMEGGEMESRYFEGGVYHLQSTGKYYQYLRFYTENFTKVDGESLQSVQSAVKKAMGITLSESRLKKAAEIAFENAKKTQDEYLLLEQKSIQGDGYTEKVTVALQGTTSEENESCYYLCAERERCYQ
ncbi:MAG: hypothetical protein MRZ97_07695 [Firmicutes bacterium]|nr:hypothetical protein [Bacillota bacterium]